MAAPLAIWLLLIGYAVAYAGFRNFGVQYQVNSDGSISPKGDSTPISLLQAFTCSGGGAPAAQPTAQNTLPSSFGITPGLRVNPQPATNPATQPNPVTLPIALPQPGLRVNPQPSFPSPVGIFDELSVGAYDALSGAVKGIESTLGGLFSHLPRIGGGESFPTLPSVLGGLRL